MKTNQREAGYILVGVLLAIVLLSVVGTSLVLSSVNSINTSNKEHTNQSVYYIAEAGLQYGVHHFEEKLKGLVESNELTNEEEFFQTVAIYFQDGLLYKEFEKVEEEQPFAKVSIIQEESDPSLFTIVSQGFLQGDRRTVKQNLQVLLEKEEVLKENKYTLPPFAVYTLGDIVIKNGRVIGDIGTHSKNGIQFPGTTNVTIDGDIYVHEGNRDLIKGMGLIEGPKVLDVEEYSFPSLPPFPEIPSDLKKLPNQSYQGHTYLSNGSLLINDWRVEKFTLPLKEDVYFKEIRVSSNNSLTLDIGNADRTIVVDRLELNGSIQLKGSGNLTVYITNDIVPAQGSLGQEDQINQINFFYAGNKPLKIINNLNIFGSIYAQSADLYIDNGGKVHGNIFTNGKKVYMSGGSDVKTQLILAPSAHFEIIAGGRIQGRVISQSFISDGGATVILKEPFVLDGPISPQSIGKNEQGLGLPNGVDSNYILKDVQIEKTPIKEID